MPTLTECRLVVHFLKNYTFSWLSPESMACFNLVCDIMFGM